MGVNNSGVNIFSGTPPLTLESTGRVFFVGNASTYVPGGVAGSDNAGSSGDSPQRPFATLDYAIGQCTAGRGDTIFVLPGHAETVAGTIAADVASIRIVGLGVGANRPTFTFDTTSDVLDISAANVEVANMVFVCNVASHTRFIYLDAEADGAWIHHCLFREGSQTGLSMVEWEGAADDVRIEDNEFYAPTAGNYDEAILIASTPTRGKILRNRIYGDFDEGGINNAVGNVATLFLIQDNVITNLLAGAEAVDLDSAVTGDLVDNRLSTDVLSTSIDQGSMRCSGNLWSSTTDGTHGVAVPATPADTTTADTVLGALIGTGGVATFPAPTAPANNVNFAEVIGQIYAAVMGTSGSWDGIASYPAAAAPGNTVSVAEVVRDIWDSLRNGTGGAEPATNRSVMDYLGVSPTFYQPKFGYLVTKSGDVSAAPDDLFTVTGKCAITLLHGEVTSIIATTTSLAIITSTNSQTIAAATQVTTDNVGTLYMVSGDPDLGLNGGGTPGLDAALLTNGSLAPFIVNDDKIYQSVNGAGTGLIQWDLWYIPLEASASVASSA